jgi:hypothetical protein
VIASRRRERSTSEYCRISLTCRTPIAWERSGSQKLTGPLDRGSAGRSAPVKPARRVFRLRLRYRSARGQDGVVGPSGEFLTRPYKGLAQCTRPARLHGSSYGPRLPSPLSSHRGISLHPTSNHPTSNHPTIDLRPSRTSLAQASGRYCCFADRCEREGIKR